MERTGTARLLTGSAVDAGLFAGVGAPAPGQQLRSETGGDQLCAGELLQTAQLGPRRHSAGQRSAIAAPLAALGESICGVTVNMLGE